MTQAELYVVATPLGNRLDITLRAIECLKSVPWIFAEDTREAMKLLDLVSIPVQGKKIHSYASHNLKRATGLAVKVLREGNSVALVTDRGTPGISDPGALLVAAARENGFPIVPVPGPCALTALVSVSGLSDPAFLFVGFFPKEAKERRALFEKVAGTGWPCCFYESPRRIRQTLAYLKEAFPQGAIFFGREMTKHFEEYGWLSLAQVKPDEVMEKGEYALLLQPGKTANPEAWHEEIALRVASDKEWSKAVARRLGVSSSLIYNALQKHK